MSVHYLHEERLRRQVAKAQTLVTRMAKALHDGYCIHPDLSLSETLGYDMALSNIEAMECFVKDQLQLPDEQMAQSIFQVLCDRLQNRLTRLPSHMQGGFL
ncbi:hypothetical protein ACFQ0F_02015 [Paraperlucidibaca wandonensis]|jgi:hypothetical protein|uniref:Uncharacterized protein n=1 Tax=Paraperlucidibaca wandonensis TaxID=1268273 RepID=A0ABW3HHE8_9GAMM|tara:strand:+ start:1124 stop:1426 length:303 start_codon:yes stop_codon:yes gene_type:complete